MKLQMAKLAQVGHLLDIPLEVEAAMEGHGLRWSVDVRAGRTLPGSGEPARADGHRVVRRVNFEGKG
jgi:hypothetical protein